MNIQPSPLGTQQFSYADLLARNAQVYAEGLALTGEFADITHAQLYVQSKRMAHALSKHGVQPGDRVAMLCSNRPEWFVLLGAVAHLGAMLIVLNTRAQADELLMVLEDSQPVLLITEASFETIFQVVQSNLNFAMLGLSLDGTTPSLVSFGNWRIGSDEPIPNSGAPTSNFLGIPTAAVTGRPQVAVLSHASVMAQALQLAQVWTLDREAVHLAVLPLFHIAGLGMAIATQSVGGSSVLMSSFDAAKAVDLIQKHKVTFFATFSPMLEAVLDATQDPEKALGSLRFLMGLESASTIERFERSLASAHFWIGYGQTETGGPVSLSRFTEQPGAAGSALPLVTLSIKADGANQTGEILVRSPSVFDGYWDPHTKAPRNSASGTFNQWHHTGDLGRIDYRGMLWFEGRMPNKALIKTGGENVYPLEVEKAISAHPAIEDSVVFGVPDEQWGEAVVAVCVCRAGHVCLSSELRDFVATRISKFKRPKHVLFMENIPSLKDGTPDIEALRRAFTRMD